MKTKINIWLVLLMWGPALAQATSNYYVDPSGSDSNDGSAGSPFKTIQKGTDMAVEGDTVTVRAGHYAGASITHSGIEGAPILFFGELGAIIDTPVDSSGVTAAFFGSGREYIIIDGFTVAPQAGQAQWDAGFRFNAGVVGGVWRHGNVYRNNTLKTRPGGAGDTYYHTLYASWQDGLLMDGNVVEDSYNSGIYTANSSRNYTIRNNIVSGGGNGIHNNGDWNAGDPGINYNATIENNIIHNIGFGLGGQAISCDGVQDSRIINNLIYDAYTKGISLYGTDAAEGSARNLVANNTIVMRAGSYVAFRMNDYALGGNQMINNIFISEDPNQASVDVEDTNALNTTTFNYNVTSGKYKVGGGLRDDWTSTYGFDPQSLVGTPAELFVTPGSDFHLIAGAPAINLGTTVPFDYDIECMLRSFGGGVDSGAYEFGSTPAPHCTGNFGNGGGGGGNGPPSTNTPNSPAAKIRITPNPWLGDRNQAMSMVVTGLLPNSPVRVFDRQERPMRSLTADDRGTANWDLNDGSGVKAASGIYTGLVKDTNNNQRKIKFAVVR